MAITERLQIVLESAGVGGVVSDFNRVGGAASGLGEKTSRTSGLLSRLGPIGQQAGSVMSGVLAGGAAAAGAAFVGLATASVNAYTGLAQSVLQFQRVSGASAEQSSALVAAFDDMGISAEKGATAIFQLGKRIGTDADKLAAYGVAAARSSNGNISLADTLLNVADAYQRTADPADRIALLTAAFGKAGKDLIPILEQGRTGIEAMFAGAESTGQILDQDDLRKAEDYRLAMDELGDTMNELKLVAGEALVPFITDLARATTGLLNLGQRINSLNGYLEGTESDSMGLAGVLDRVLDKVMGWDSANEEVAGSTATIAGTIEQAGGTIEETNKKIETSTLGVTSAQRAYEASTRAVAAADRTLADARADYNRLLKAGAVDEEKVADARRSLNDATRSLGSAQRELARSQEEYNDAQAAFLALPTDTNADRLAEAGDNLADSQDGVASAAEREKAAAADLARARAGDPEFNDKLAAAKQRVTDAEQGHADAMYTASQRAYELDVALTEQNTLLTDNAEAVGFIRSEWEKLLARKPEIAAFLAGPLASLPPGPGSLAGSGAGPGYGLRDYEMKPGGLLVGGGGSGNLSPVTHNNIQITTQGVADPLTLARAILWQLP